MKDTSKDYPDVIPWAVTITLVIVLSITVWNGIRAWTTFANWELLTRFRANPAYIFATGIFWFVLGVALIVLILKGSRITPLCGFAVCILYILWYWVDRLFLQVSPVTNIPFSIVVSIIGLVIFNISLFWPSSRAFFKETQ
jgi:hypothetical protein